MCLKIDPENICTRQVLECTHERRQEQIDLIAISWVTNAWAAEGSGFTRATWDEIWRWVNFFILFGVIIKFGRRPILQGPSQPCPRRSAAAAGASVPQPAP